MTLKKRIDPEKDRFNLEWKNSMKETPMREELYEKGAQVETLRKVLAEAYFESVVRAIGGLHDPQDTEKKFVGPVSKGITLVEVQE